AAAGCAQIAPFRTGLCLGQDLPRLAAGHLVRLVFHSRKGCVELAFGSGKSAVLRAFVCALPVISGVTFRALRAGRALHTLDALRAFRALCACVAFQALRALRAGVALVALGAWCALCASRALFAARALDALRPLFACVAFRPCVAGVTLV